LKITRGGGGNAPATDIAIKKKTNTKGFKTKHKIKQ